MRFLMMLIVILNSQIAQALNQADSNNFKTVLDLAMKGDYQAQRNIAYGYADYPYKGQNKNAILGCAWYLVVLNSGSSKLHAGDTGNVRVYCGQLNETSQQAALVQAKKLYKKIYKKEPRF